MEKKYKGAEKRKHKRIVFSAKEEVTGVVTWPEHGDTPFTYRISDIGAGGVRFILSKESAPDVIGFNDKLSLQQISGNSALEFVSGVVLEVRWVIQHDMFEHMVIGCEFVDIPNDVQAKIDAFVASEAELRSQDNG